MPPIALILTFFAVALLLLALRGRIAERGVFCRACAFDLAGIDLHAAEPRCPECGRAIASVGATRPHRRARRTRLLVLATAMLLLGVGLSAFHFTGSAASIYTAMPDRIVLGGASWGSDEALDELLIRLGNPAETPEWFWNRAVEEALSQQAEPSRPWDPRWGEVVSIAWQGNRLSEEQIARFVRNGTVPEVHIRERYSRGDPWISYSVDLRYSRVSALNMYRPGFIHIVGRAAFGVTLDGKQWEGSAGGGSIGEFILPARAPGGSSGGGSSIQVPADIAEQLNPGDQFDVFFEFRHSLRRISDDTMIESQPLRISRRITVVPAGESAVALRDDPQAATRIRKGSSATSIIGVVKTSPGERDYPVQFAMYFTDLPHSVAGKVYLRHPSDGELYEAGNISQAARSITDPQLEPSANWSTGQFIVVSKEQDTPEQREAFRRVTRDGVVDITFTTDPEAAIHNPRIHEVVQLDMEFRGVPVIWAATSEERSAAQRDSPITPASTPTDAQP